MSESRTTSDPRRKLLEALFTVGGLVGIILAVNPPPNPFLKFLIGLDFVIFMASSVVNYSDFIFQSRKSGNLVSLKRGTTGITFSLLLISTLASTYSDFVGSPLSSFIYSSYLNFAQFITFIIAVGMLIWLGYFIMERLAE